ncbi:MAG: MiaB/RimO family radical SAM methylthiotransferase [Firmicutes bacterium]|nr:MiaB/RimO family radical SAM methylthiotransferase [Bacillota bacterium]
MKVIIITLGCRSNQYEADKIKQKLEEQGVFVSQKFDDGAADFVVLNTCSITHIADKKSRNLISKAKKHSPKAKVIAVGCSSEKNREQFKGVDLVLGTKDKMSVISFIMGFQDIAPANGKLSAGAISFNPADKVCVNVGVAPKGDPQKKQKALLKIQDGCNNFCSYCIVPHIRGRSVSRDINEVLAEAEELAKVYKQIVITAINISDFKVDGQYALVRLVRELGERLPKTIFSFGSLYPSDISNELLEAMKKAGNFEAFFHLSMQSGSDEVLKHMGRKYSGVEFLEKVALIRKHFKKTFISCDVIVGYPTETDKHFAETVAVCKTARFDHMHIFVYSRREGTPAALLPEVAHDIKESRSKILAKLNK